MFETKVVEKIKTVFIN